MPSERPEFLQLEKGDDVPSVRDRLSFIHGKRVLLIWPEEGTVLTRKLDLVLIQREAMRRAIRLALVTHDPQVIQHATELNISTFETIGASERGRWRRGRSKVFTSRFQRPDDTPEPDELMPVASRVRSEESEGFGLWRSISRIMVLLLLLGVTVAAAVVIAPGATVTIAPARQIVSVEVPLTADFNASDLDVENAIIPATRLSVTVEETSTIPTTGVQQLADIPATGTVVFVNQTGGAVDIPTGTTLSTSAGTPILFRTLQEGEVAAGVGQQLEVPIEALQGSAGEIGNVDSGLINSVVGDLGTRLTVRNINPTAGGTSRSIAAVSQTDMDLLLATVRQQLQSRAYEVMLPQLSETQFLILETIKIAEERSDWMTFSSGVGDVADTLTLTMRAIVEATAVDEQFGHQVIYSRLSLQIPRGREIRPETITYESGPVQQILQDGRVSFSMSGSGLVASQLNTGQLQENMAGRSIDEAMAYLLSALDLDEGSLPQITISPDWFGRMPLLPVRIDLRIVEPAA